jgi:hypothetical protein
MELEFSDGNIFVAYKKTVYLQKNRFMANTMYNSMVVDNYFHLLQTLKREDKLNLVALLMNNITDTQPTKKATSQSVIDKFFGAWKSEKSAEEMIDEIRSSRTFTRQIATF